MSDYHPFNPLKALEVSFAWHITYLGKWRLAETWIPCRLSTSTLYSFIFWKWNWSVHVAPWALNLIIRLSDYFSILKQSIDREIKAGARCCFWDVWVCRSIIRKVLQRACEVVYYLMFVDGGKRRSQDTAFGNPCFHWTFVGNRPVVDNPQ